MASQNPRLKRFNFNKWKKNIGDCAIRAIVAAIGMDYELVCKKLGVSFKRGHGLIRDTGINLDLIKSRFNEYFDIVEDFGEQADFIPPDASQEDIDLMNQVDLELGSDPSVSGITLSEFMDLYDKQGAFLVGLVGNPKAANDNSKNGGHIVCCRCLRKNPAHFIDTFDSSEMVVDCYMRIKKVVPKDSPEHFKWDKEKQCFY